MSDPRSVAETAARAGAEVLLEHAGRVTGLRTKSGSADLVSAADIAAGVAVVRSVAERLEGARFVVEEPEVYALAGVTAGTLEDGEVWVIDPLDGTTSFVHGYPCWSVSVACLRDGMPVAGAVYNVPADELCSAAAGAGATCGGAPLLVRGASTIEDASSSQVSPTIAVPSSTASCGSSSGSSAPRTTSDATDRRQLTCATWQPAGSTGSGRPPFGLGTWPRVC
jgi:fructose-1,6-bisphosphatase/inositol monophosphatase family enzyme